MQAGGPAGGCGLVGGGLWEGVACGLVVAFMVVASLWEGDGLAGGGGRAGLQPVGGWIACGRVDSLWEGGWPVGGGGRAGL